MKLHIGIKSDPIEYRFSFGWLFDLMKNRDLHYFQLGSFAELYTVDDEFFLALKDDAERMNIIIKSCFTAHRELGGFFSGNRHLENAARKNYERYIHIAALLGADYLGGNPGSVYRDRLDYKKAGIECYLSHMKELMGISHLKGLKALTMEPMSSIAEPPSTPQEIDYMMECLAEHHRGNRETTVPVYLCGDVSHGLADKSGQVIHDNMALYQHAIPHMAEFHFKNTDRIFNSTFGFVGEDHSDCSESEGIVNLRHVKQIIEENESKFPVDELVGYLELPGPKLGRDYADPLLKDQLENSISALKAVFE